MISLKKTVLTFAVISVWTVIIRLNKTLSKLQLGVNSEAKKLEVSEINVTKAPRNQLK